MIPTIPYIEKKFKEYNDLIFEGKLPIVPIKLSKATKFLGKCIYYRKVLPNRSVVYGHFLRFSVCFDLAENELDDVIIHEMIHLFIAVNNIQDTSSHGRNFKTLMLDINARFHRNITIKYNGQGNVTSNIPKAKWHVLAVVNFRDGKTGIKVLPRVAQSIINYYTAVLSNKEVSSIELYMVKDPFFERYPNSSTLKVHFIDTQELMPHLKGAEKMACNGKKIIRNV